MSVSAIIQQFFLAGVDEWPEQHSSIWKTQAPTLGLRENVSTAPTQHSTTPGLPTADVRLFHRVYFRSIQGTGRTLINDVIV